MSSSTTIDKLQNRAVLTYTEMRELASSPDVDVRRTLAQRDDLKPELLYYLAEDEDAEVRSYVAQNPATPRQADLILATDLDDMVRIELTAKVAKLHPELNAREQDKIGAATFEVLSILTNDQLTRVREILAETLKDVAHAPPDLIRQLARDVEKVVSAPVLQFSPVLNDEDLLEIIRLRPHDEAVSAIAVRQTVSEKVSDAVINADEVDAITALLSNPQAQIREEALDALVEKAEKVEKWHGPLVHRPYLNSNAARRLASYVAENLLDVLAARKELPPDVMEAVAEEVHRRLGDGADQIDDTVHAGEMPIDVVKRLETEGVLSHELFRGWIKKNNRELAMAALAHFADMDVVTIKKAISSQSAKGLMALTWKAGLEIDYAEDIQLGLAKMPFKNIMKPGEDGTFPLTEDEMNWQIELFEGF